VADTWNHAIRPATVDEIDLYVRQGWNCATGRCCAPVSHVISYNLVTGRSGRVGSRETKVCTAHADKFAVKHGLTMPEMEDAQ